MLTSGNKIRRSLFLGKKITLGRKWSGYDHTPKYPNTNCLNKTWKTFTCWLKENSIKAFSQQEYTWLYKVIILNHGHFLCPRTESIAQEDPKFRSCWKSTTLWSNLLLFISNHFKNVFVTVWCIVFKVFPWFFTFWVGCTAPQKKREYPFWDYFFLSYSYVVVWFLLYWTSSWMLWHFLEK